MGFSTGNASFDNLMRRARSRKLAKDAVSDTTIDVQSSEEKQNENNNDNVKTESQLMDELSGLGVKATTTGTIFSWCALEANSGTTPPYFSCIDWLAVTLECTTPFIRTAAEVSSQLDSIPRMMLSLYTFIIVSWKNISKIPIPF